FNFVAALPYHFLPSFPTRRSSDLTQRVRRALLRRLRLLLIRLRGFVRLHLGDRDRQVTRLTLAPDGDRRLGSRLRVADHARQIRDRKSTRLNSSHVKISYAVFCLI